MPTEMTPAEAAEQLEKVKKNPWMSVKDADAIAYASSVLRKLAAGKMVEVVHGEWSEYRRYELTPSLNGYQCSVCKSVVQYQTKYCYSCGARMDGKDGSHETN